MKARPPKLLTLLLLLPCAFLLLSRAKGVSAQPQAGQPLIIGKVLDTQGGAISEADVTLIGGSDQKVLETTITQDDGLYALPVPHPMPAQAAVQIQRNHFKPTRLALGQENIRLLQAGEPIVMPDTVLERRIGAAFWIALAIFLGVLVLIATGILHNTLAALVGAAGIFAVSYIGGAIRENLFILSFTDSLRYIDWNVIFLIMGMMIVIAVVENTGIFQWLAYFSYRVSWGRTFLLLPILMLITGAASAFLDNVTTMLLMTPITVQIALSLGINPLSFLMPEVLASNVIGVSTLVGTPTNILIGSFGNISFNDFLANLTPGVLLSFAGLIIYSAFIYRGELSGAREPSRALLERLAERGRITEPDHLKKAAVVGTGMLVLFVLGEQILLQPAVTALIGATTLLVWIRPDIEEMIEAVDWTTLVFFISLFIVVGAIREVGLISLIAGAIGSVVGGSLTLSMLAVIWLSAGLSTVVANIPFTAAMLPVVGFLSSTVPGAHSKVLFYCLSVGSAMGGNGSLIGASANMVTAGIADSAGYPISYGYFLRKGFPALLVTVGLATIWLFVRF
jgi:Na+/H+ antiporter NhaD/arsenite permease-like protein